MPVGVVGILLLQIASIRQEDFAKVGGGLRTENRSTKAIPDKRGQISAVVDMGMRQDDRIDGTGIDRNGTQFFRRSALKP